VRHSPSPCPLPQGRGIEELSNNPFAIVVMAHLLAQATAKDHYRRLNEKLILIKQLYRKGFSKQNIINLFHFIDWIMSLPKAEELLFWDELSVMEKEEKMPYITSVERIGFDRGIQEGVLQGQFLIIANLIAKKFHSQPEHELQNLKKLNADALLELGEKLFEFHSVEQVHEWISSKN
jgi:hypothetical protein